MAVASERVTRTSLRKSAPTLGHFPNERLRHYPASLLVTRAPSGPFHSNQPPIGGVSSNPRKFREVRFPVAPFLPPRSGRGGVSESPSRSARRLIHRPARFFTCFFLFIEGDIAFKSKTYRIEIRHFPSLFRHFPIYSVIFRVLSTTPSSSNLDGIN